MALRSPDLDDWIAQARGVDLMATAEALGAKLKRVGSEFTGPCPGCGGSDRFSISVRKGVFNCGHQGGAGGDVIALVQHVNSVEFMDAVEFLAGPRPSATTNGFDHEAADERRAERRDHSRDDARARQAEDAGARAKRREAAAGLWADGKPILGSGADTYLRARGIMLLPEQAFDLRFVKDLVYHGYRDADDQEGAELGAYPAMIAAIRNVAGELLGVHRTFLDPARPRKLEPPGDRSRNRAKKILGNAKGGMIWLSPPRPCMATGEGIETTLSWYALGVGPDDCGIAAAISWGNLSGGSTDMLPHPKIKGRTVQNGTPDLDQPGITFGEDVSEIIMLGDGDSDPYATRARLLTGARRFAAQRRSVSVCMAPEGQDFNDVLVAQRKDEAA